jgi:hypothetical protein
MVFSTKFNPRGPNIKAIVNKHIHLINECQSLKKIFPKGVMTAYKHEKKLKELLMRGDPYTIINNQLYTNQHGYTRCNQTCDSCDNFVFETDHITSYATGKIYSIKKDFTCKTKFVVYCAICLKCKEQGIGSTVDWKRRLANYKNHIKKRLSTCCITKHFFQKCINNENPCSNLKFVILDKVDNTEKLSEEQKENLLFQKEKFWIGNLITQHQGMNGTHDWNRTKRTDKRIK